MLVISENPLQERSFVQYMEMQHDAIDKPALPSYYTEVDNVYPVPKEYSYTRSTCHRRILSQDSVVSKLLYYFVVASYVYRTPKSYMYNFEQHITSYLAQLMVNS